LIPVWGAASYYKTESFLGWQCKIMEQCSWTRKLLILPDVNMND
jgi:hypothetical protein